METCLWPRVRACVQGSRNSPGLGWAAPPATTQPVASSASVAMPAPAPTQCAAGPMDTSGAPAGPSGPCRGPAAGQAGGPRAVSHGRHAQPCAWPGGPGVAGWTAAGQPGRAAQAPAGVVTGGPASTSQGSLAPGQRSSLRRGLLLCMASCTASFVQRRAAAVVLDLADLPMAPPAGDCPECIGEINNSLNACEYSAASCVSSQNDDEKHFVLPWQYEGNQASAISNLLDIATGTVPHMIMLWQNLCQ